MSKSNKSLLREIADEIDAFDKMFASLVEILEEKGILTQEELEKRVRLKASKAGGFTNYRSIQFDEKK
jgi:transcription initiation factor IIE alpha subunit